MVCAFRGLSSVSSSISDGKLFFLVWCERKQRRGITTKRRNKHSEFSYTLSSKFVFPFLKFQTGPSAIYERNCTTQDSLVWFFSFQMFSRLLKEGMIIYSLVGLFDLLSQCRCEKKISWIWVHFVMVFLVCFEF